MKFFGKSDLFNENEKKNEEVKNNKIVNQKEIKTAYEKFAADLSVETIFTILYSIINYTTGKGNIEKEYGEF